MRSICHVAVRMRIKEPNDLPACCLPAKNFFLKFQAASSHPFLTDGFHGLASTRPLSVIFCFSELGLRLIRLRCLMK
jgi:hypothetical protein